jgi:hypothetical protein
MNKQLVPSTISHSSELSNLRVVLGTPEFLANCCAMEVALETLWLMSEVRTIL